MTLVHASCVNLNGVGILIRGQSGAGKSSLSLRLIMENGAKLVSDDQVLLSQTKHHLCAAPPETIQGMIEVRGLGLVRVPFLVKAQLSLIVDLTDATLIERLPDPDTFQDTLLGVTLPRIKLDPKLPQSAAIIFAAMQHFYLG